MRPNSFKRSRLSPTHNAYGRCCRSGTRNPSFSGICGLTGHLPSAHFVCGHRLQSGSKGFWYQTYNCRQGSSRPYTSAAAI